MSALLRALMAQKTGGGDKPNLAIVKENTVTFDGLANRNAVNIGVTAKMGEFQPVHVSFDYKIVITDALAEGLPHAFIMGKKFVGRPRLDQYGSIGTYSSHFEGDWQSRYNSDERNVDIFVLDCNGTKGACTVSNLVITEA